MVTVYTYAFDKRLADAIELFELQPGFAAAQLRMRDEMDELDRETGLSTLPFGTRRRAENALSWFRIWSRWMVRIVSSIRVHRAFIALLDHAEREAWRKFTGFYPEVMRSTAPEAQSLLDEIEKLKPRLIREGYERVVAQETGRTNDSRTGEIPQIAPAETDPVAQVAEKERVHPNRARVDDFIERVAKAGWKITRTIFWGAAGYKDATEFERWQSSHSRCTGAARQNFGRLLSMTPEEFAKRFRPD